MCKNNIFRQDAGKTKSAGAPGDTMEVDTPSEGDDDEEMLVTASEGRAHNGTAHASTVAVQWASYAIVHAGR